MNLPVTISKPERSLANYTRDLKGKIDFCTEIVKSGLYSKKVSTPQAALVLILRGEELGFSPLASLDLIDFYNGKPNLSAAALSAIAMANGGRFRIHVSNSAECKITASRRENGFERTVHWTIGRAKNAGLITKDNWKNDPEAMMYARCMGTLVRSGWPDIIAGLYSTEEMSDGPDLGPEPEGSSGATDVIELTQELPPEMVAQSIPADDITASNERRRKKSLSIESGRRSESVMYDIRNEPDDVRKQLCAIAFERGAVVDKEKIIHCFEEIPELSQYEYSGVEGEIDDGEDIPL